MEIKVTKSELSRVLGITGKMVSKNPVNPVMEYLMVNRDDNGVYVLSTNESGSLTVRMNCECVGDFKPVCIQASQIIPAVSSIPDQPLSIVVDDLKVSVKYNGGKFNVVGINPDEFVMPQSSNAPIREFAVKANDFSSFCKKALSCSSYDTLRPVLSGVAIDANKEGITFVGTDGSIMFTSSCELDSFSGEEGITVIPRLIVPVIDIMLQGKDKVSVTDDGRMVTIETDDSRMSIIGVEGKFPKYKSVFPISQMVLKVPRLELYNIIKRVSLFSSSSGMIVFTCNEGKITIEAKDIDFSKQAVAEMNVESDNKIRIGFNCTKLITLLSACDGNEISMGFVDSSRAVEVIGEASRSVIMPMMLED